MKKRFISMILTLALVLSLVSAMGVTVSATDVSSELQNTINAVTTSDTIKLTADISEDITIPAGKTITLDLNGKVLKGHIDVKGTLTLTDSAIENNTHYFHYEEAFPWVYLDNPNNTQTKAAVEYNAINNTTEYVKVHGGIVIAGLDKEGVKVEDGGTFNMEAGSIIGNQRGVMVCGSKTAYGTFNMYGGLIAGNAATNTFGGGVMAFHHSKFNMTGGNICYNYASGNGAGVYLQYQEEGAATGTITGGIISHNTSAGYGGGIFVHTSKGALTLGGTVEVKDNKKGTSTNNVRIDSEGTITISTSVTPSGMSAGITIGDNGTIGTFASNCSETAKQYFFSDSDKYEVKFETDHLVLREPLELKAADASKTYDGTALSKNEFTSNASLALINNDVVIATVAGIVTDAGIDVANEVTEYKVMRGEVDVTSEYTIVTKSGVLRVNPAEVTITSASDSKQYDGKALTNGGVTATGFIGDDGATYTVTGSQTEVGSSENTFTYELNEGTKDTNYNITTEAGVLTVTAIPSAPEVYSEPDPVISVPVSAAKDAPKIQVTVSGSNATVKELTKEEVETIGKDGNVVVDLSSLSDSVSGALISKNTFANIAASLTEGLEVKMPNGSIAIFDKTVLSTVAQQAEGSNIRFALNKDSKAEQTMTKAQKDTVEDLSKPVVLDISLTSNGKNISEFNGGKADIIVDYETTQPVRVWCVTDDGKTEVVPSTSNGKIVTFTASHFSHYVVAEYDENNFKTCPQDETCVYSSFLDAGTKAWYHDGVHFCIANGYMSGYTNNLFGPKDTLSRAMAVQILYNLEGKPAVQSKSIFTDVKDTAWYADAIIWATESNIVGGVGNGLFNPKDAVTREQLATMYYRYSIYKGYDVSASDELTAYYDAALVRNWALPALKWAKAAGLMNGRGNGILDPRGNANRAEAATMIMNFCEKVAK